MTGSLQYFLHLGSNQSSTCIFVELNWLMMNEYIVINTLFLFHIPNYNVHLIVHLLLSFQIIPFQLDKYSIFNVPNPFIITTL